MTKLTGKQKFLNMFHSLPENSRSELICYTSGVPRSLNVISFEIKNDIPSSKDILINLGYEDD